MRTESWPSSFLYLKRKTSTRAKPENRSNYNKKKPAPEGTGERTKTIAGRFIGRDKRETRRSGTRATCEPSPLSARRSSR